MRKISVDFLREGMRVAKPIYNSAGQPLLKVGVELNDKYIQYLRKLGITAIYIVDNLTEDILIEDVIPDELRIKTIKEIKTVFTKQGTKGIFSVQDTLLLERNLHDIVDELTSNKDTLVNIVDIRSYDDYTYAHSVNVSVLAIMTGISMGLSRPVLYHLGMGAMLHDLGKMYVPKPILNKPGRLTAEEFAIMKEHSIHSYRTLQKQSSISNLSALISYEHHEKFDGSGYPQGLKGDEIHFLSQITGMVDMFDALTADRVYRRAFPVHEACEMVAAAGDYYFDYKIILPFLNNIAPYPLGTVVELSNGSIGVVSNVEKGYPGKPTIKILTDEEKQIITPYEVNLGTKLNLVIIGLVPEDEINKFNTIKVG